MKARLALEDGTIFTGESFGAAGEVAGEVVFNTSLSGYQEILTDPSYAGQMVAMTNPQIGNYGVNKEDLESARPQVVAYIVRELSPVVSNFRAEGDLESFLGENNIPGISGIDTRRLTRHIRLEGAMKGVLSTADGDEAALVEKAKSSPGLVGRDMIATVTTKKPYDWDEGFISKFGSPRPEFEGETLNVVAVDYGAKYNILRCLVENGFKVKVVPADFPSEEILKLKPDGVFLSNGPGDPAGAPYAADIVKQLLGKVPIFGICMGHQILSTALGAKTYKLKFGHRGANQPVKRLDSGKVDITSQNHGFAVDADSLPSGVEVTHVNLNDGTNEGMRHKSLPCFSVQYHPEASPGPHDTLDHFAHFRSLMLENM
ncbi:MAG: glutamine-hydrolyzing carbamoyl-phosphate synthase small subunit [Planctomycetota bacterium]|nr:MAG: glutamine-hydrolyzing carbamoyl-phosphate synthase small subunit [Planctomycetota bacterium]